MIARAKVSKRLTQAAAVSLALLAAAPCAAEEDTAPDAPPRSYVDIDLTLLNAGISGAVHAGSRIYVGGGGSFFPAASINTFAAYPIEIVEGHGFARWAPTSGLQFDAGLRVAWVQDFRACVSEACADKSSALVGPYADVHFGLRHLKVGPRLAYAVRTESGEQGVLLYPFILRVQLTP